MNKGAPANVVEHAEAIELLRGARRVFLLEPPYRRKYPPLGLAKIATFVKRQGGRAWFGRRYLGPPVDLICVSTLMTTTAATVAAAIKEAHSFAPKTPILVGGIYASLMSEDLFERVGHLAKVVQGYLPELDACPPDYSLPWDLEEPWGDFSFSFTTRGCPNRCPYCAVPKLEPGQWVNPTWRDHIALLKPCAMISDNNLSAAPVEHVHAVVDHLARANKQVVFDNGLEAKRITPELARLLGRLRFTRSGMRTSFDRPDDEEHIPRAAALLRAAGVPKGEMTGFVLFNFIETPREAERRMRIVQAAGLRPYPQQYQPLMRTGEEETFISKRWTRTLLRAFRGFWLLSSFNQKFTFEEFLRSDVYANPSRHFAPLTDEDWAAWAA